MPVVQVRRWKLGNGFLRIRQTSTCRHCALPIARQNDTQDGALGIWHHANTGGHSGGGKIRCGPNGLSATVAQPPEVA